MLLWLARHAEVLLCDLPCRLDALGSTGGEENSGHALGRVGEQSLGQLNGPWVVVGPKRHEVQLHHLLLCRIRKFLAAVAYVAGE